MTVTLPDPWPANPWPTRFRTVRASPEGALHPGLRIVTVQSPALRGRGDMAVHVTRAASIDDGVPVVVLLHGVYGSFWNWMLNGRAHETVDRLVAQQRIRPMVLVAPSDGLAGEGTAYLKHPVADYERWIIDDVIDCVCEFVEPVSARSPLFIAGNSMGGFGAGRLGARHASRFAGIALHSPITHLDQLAAFTEHDVGDDVGLSAEERDLLTGFAGTRVPLPPTYIDCGIVDPLWASNLEFHHRLDEFAVGHEFHEYDGGHDWDSWAARLPHSLAFFEANLART